jgi:hypothetical protein
MHENPKTFPGDHLCSRPPPLGVATPLSPTILKVPMAWVHTCDVVESNSRTFQGHSRPCISKFNSRTFKDVRHAIQGLNTEEKALEIGKMWRWIVQNVTLMSFKQLCQIWTYKINSTKCPFLNDSETISENIHELKQEEFKDSQKNFFTNSRTSKALNVRFQIEGHSRSYKFKRTMSKAF